MAEVPSEELLEKLRLQLVRQRVRELREAGRGVSAIARKYRCSRQTVYSALE